MPSLPSVISFSARMTRALPKHKEPKAPRPEKSFFTRLDLWRYAAFLLCLGLVSPSLQAASAEKTLEQAFRSAADEFAVPAELLKGVSYTTTAWHNARGFDAHSAQEFGVMGLRSQSEGPTLEAAASLVDLPVEVVRDQEIENIRAGAALLAFYAREANGGEPPAAEFSLETAAVWWETLTRYSGVAEPRHQDLYAAQVFETLDRGAEGRADNGELIVLQPTVLPQIIGDWIVDAREQYRRQVEAMSPDVDYSGASWAPACSSNYSDYSRTASSISYVIIHKVEGSYSGCISWFQNCSSNVSSHYVVSFQGDVTQMVLEEDVAWHAGNWDYNLASVGIEHEGYTYSNDNTDALYRASADLTADICDRNNISKSRTYIIGHDEVPGATHTDPGPYWDWDYYMSLVTGGGDPPDPDTGNLVGYIREYDIYSGDAVAGAAVSLDTGRTTTADSSGYYTFTNVPVGTYTVTARAECYESNSVSKTIQAGIDNWASIALTPSDVCGQGCDNFMPAKLPNARVHTASTSPLDRLPWSSAGFLLCLTGGLFLISRRRR